MTEAEWLICTDPKSMLDFLRGPESFVRGCWVVDPHLGKG